jgi:hypothetical protein
MDHNAAHYKLIVTSTRSGGYAIVCKMCVQTITQKNTVCTLMKFSENVHIVPSKKPVNFGYDPW